MNTKITVLTIFKFCVGGLGVALWFYRNSLFSAFAREGSSEADVVHTVLVNNHGSFSYITPNQDEYLRALTVASWTLFGLMMVVDIVQRKFFNGQGEGRSNRK